MKKALCMLLFCALVLTVPAIGEEAAAPFSHASDAFSMDTALYALKLALQHSSKSGETLFSQNGFSIVRQENYNRPTTDHSHTSAYTVATTEMPVRGETRNLVVISIRGTGDGEWYSNFDFAPETKGESAYAENFMQASEAIFETVKGDIDQVEDPVVLVTGYSRGGACANLLGVLLDSEYGAEDIYVYTFATPNTVRTADTGYPNIFNLVNMNDAVTRLPPTGWGFRRAGIDVELRAPGTVNTAMHEMFLALLGACPDIDSYYGIRHSIPGVDGGVTFFELFQIMAAYFTGDEADDVQRATLEAVLTTQNDMARFFSLFMGAAGPSGEGGDIAFFNQHAPGVYLELMRERTGS